jgi:hypothetical protein
MPAQDDLDRLRDFVYDVTNLCFSVITEHPGWLKRELLEPFNAAWPEVADRVDRLGADYESLLGDERLEERLAQVGLSGAQLELKLSMYSLYREEYRAQPNRRRLARLLRAADVILGSLSKLVGRVEPLKEFKEAIESSLVFWRRRRKPPDS